MVEAICPHGNLRVHIISYLPQVGQIISYLPTQNKYYFLRVQIISYLFKLSQS